MRFLKIIIVILALPSLLSAQDQEHCANFIILNLVSLNFVGSPCEYTEGSGLDPTIEIYDLNGNLLIINEVQNLMQTGPEYNVPFTNSTNPDCCGNGYTQVLGIFPINDILLDFYVEIYEKDGGCCDGYVPGNDDLYADDFIVINIIDEVTGTIDVGSCISFNYELDITPIYEYGRNEVDDTVCPDYNININNIDYNINNPIGFDTVWGGSANGCDSFIQVELDFFDFEEPEIIGDAFICFDGSQILTVDGDYETYEWSTGATSAELFVDMPGLYSVIATNADGCTSETFFSVEYNDSFFPVILGEQDFCEGGQTELAVDDGFTAYLWSNGSDAQSIIVDEAGTYSVTVINSDGCESQNLFEVGEIVLDVPQILGDNIFCFGESTVLTAYNEFNLFEWSNGETTPNIEVTEPGEYFVTISSPIGCSKVNSIVVEERPEYIEQDTLYTCDPALVGDAELVVTSPVGCTGRLFQRTELYAPIPNYELIQYPYIISGTSLDLFVEIDPSLDATINWYVQDSTLLCADCPTVSVSPEVTTTYEVEIQYHPACSLLDTFELRVRSDTKIYVPNVFTPDSQDGNNLFTVFGPDLLRVDVMNIYDRWGTLLFEGVEQDLGWDGTKGGLELVNGVYAYYIEVTFKDETTKALVGDITLLR